jgi:phospholipase/carboxylesterase
MRWVVSPDHSHDEFVSGVTFGGTLESTSRHPISSGDPDPHVPWSRVEASARELERMGARVELMRHTGRPQTIMEKELEVARSLIFSLL